MQTTDYAKLFKHIEALQNWVVQHRRHLHQYPELSLQEKKTSSYCQRVLKDLGYVITPSFGYGFIADLNIPGATERIAFRAEMDALPIQEQNTHSYVSKHTGIAHMCGHDAHMAIALLTAKILYEFKAELACHVRFIFQPSEEELPGGAREMIAQGCLKNVNAIYGLHTLASIEVGTIFIRTGVLMGTSSPFTVHITGKGCHAAKPQEGLNPISAAAELISIWHHLSDQVKSEYPPVLSVTQIQSGTANNVIPATAQLRGALRAFSQEDLALMQQKMRDSLQVLIAQGYQINLEFETSYPCVVNSVQSVQKLLEAAKLIPDLKVDILRPPVFFVEDFSYYLQQCEGAFYFLGVGNAAQNKNAPLHSAHYDLDESALSIGAKIMSLLALEYSCKN